MKRKFAHKIFLKRNHESQSPTISQNVSFYSSFERAFDRRLNCGAKFTKAEIFLLPLRSFFFIT